MEVKGGGEGWVERGEGYWRGAQCADRQTDRQTLFGVLY